MTSILKYRLIGLTLAVIFAVFNVGLPIVVASCPMMKYSDSNQCFMCDDGSASTSSRLTNWFDKSCCETKYAADRNTTEFLQTTKCLTIANPLSVIQSVSPVEFSEFYTISSMLFSGSSPPRTTDIPIFVSSLLI